MRRSRLRLIGSSMPLLLAACSTGNEPTAAPVVPLGPRVIVTRSEARLLFPKPPRVVFLWGGGVGQPPDSFYQWEGLVPGQAGLVHLRLSYEPQLAPADRRTGDLPGLLPMLRPGIVLDGGLGGATVPGQGTVRMTLTARHLELSLSGAAAVARVFATRPPTITFRVKLRYEKPVEYAVPVEYF